MKPRNDVARYRRNWQEEIDSAAIYAAIAQVEKAEKLAEVYRRLSASQSLEGFS